MVEYLTLISGCACALARLRARELEKEGCGRVYANYHLLALFMNIRTDLCAHAPV